MYTKIPDGMICVPIKMGNKVTAPGKEYLGIKDLEIIDCLDPKDGNRIVGSRDEVAFGTIFIPRSYKPKILDALKPEGVDAQGNIPDPSKYRARSRYISEADLKVITGDSNIITKWRQKDLAVPPITAKSFSDSFLKDTVNYDPKKTINNIDLNATGGGDHLIAGSTPAFATYALAYADLINLIAALRFILDGAVTESTASQITEDLGAFDFSTISNNAPNGDVTQGYILSINHDGHTFDLQMEGPGNVYIQDQYTKRIAAAAAGRYDLCTISTIGTACNIFIKKNLCDGNNLSKRFMLINDTTPLCYILRNLMFDTEGTGADNTGILAFGINSNSIIANNIAYDIDGNTGYPFFINSQVVTLIGNFGGNAKTTVYQAVGNAIGRNNSDDDGSGADGNFGTGTNNVPSIAPANEFESLVKTNEAYFDLKRDGSSQLDNVGLASGIAGDTTGIRGRATPGIVSVAIAIGSAQLKITPTFTSIDPTEGDTAGGTPFSIVCDGAGDVQSTGFLKFDTDLAIIDTWGNKLITGTTPAHTAGLVNATIQNSDGNSVVASNAYEYKKAGGGGLGSRPTGPAVGAAASPNF